MISVLQPIWRQWRDVIVSAALIGLVSGVLLFHNSVHAEEVPLNSTAEALHRLFDSEWDYQMEQHPTWASMLGDRRWNDRWPERSLDAIEKRHQHNLQVIAKLKFFDRNALNASDQLNYDLFLKDYNDEIEGHQFHLYLMPLDQRGGIQT